MRSITGHKNVKTLSLKYVTSQNNRRYKLMLGIIKSQLVLLYVLYYVCVQ